MELEARYRLPSNLLGCNNEKDVNLLTYVIKQVDSLPDWETVEPISISEYNWGGDYRPKTTARLCYITEEGFLLRIECEEQNPKAVYFHDNDPVYKDSCLEFFVNFKPHADSSGYINFEGNANGSLLCGYGNSRHNRKMVKDFGTPQPKVKPFRESNLWGYELWIPLSLIRKIYSDSSFKKGDILKGNFFKCGDETSIPHYGSWTKIGSPAPDYHLPEYFGTLEIG